MNQNPEQIARDTIDKHLRACGWVIQSKSQINLGASQGVAVREYQTDIGPQTISSSWTVNLLG
jgi:type I restriction enzyme R subunit